MIEAETFIGEARRLGYTHFAGVPCSFFKPFINYVIGAEGLDYVGATSEGEAAAVSLGAHLGGRKTVTMCQNSGLGNMVNPLTSLNHPFCVPTLIITTWRGQPGVQDEPQHEQMGQIMHRLLDTLEIPWAPFPKEPEGIPGVLAEADARMQETLRPYALVMEKGTVAPHPLGDLPRPRQRRGVAERLAEAPAGERLTRTDALRAVLAGLEGDEAVIATTGKTGRELYEIGDRENQLYVVGGMGTASAIGFGLAQARPDRHAVVLDGDGAALMKMGNFATVGHYRPRNLLHVLLDNEVHDSTGGQATAASTTDFVAVAAAAGYAHAVRADRAKDICAAVGRLRGDGPSLLHVKIRPGSPPELGRPSVKPWEVKERLMSFLAGDST